MTQTNPEQETGLVSSEPVEKQDVPKKSILEKVTDFLSNPTSKPEDIEKLSPEEKNMLKRLAMGAPRKVAQKPKNFAKKRRNKRKAQKKARKTQRAFRKH